MDLFDDLPEPKLFSIKPYVAERQGERDAMQDAHVLCKDFSSVIPDLDSSVERLAFFGLYDGHGGSRASCYSAKNLHLNVATKFPKGDVNKIHNEIKTCFIDSFAKTDKDFLIVARKEKPSWKDGTTALICLFIDNTLYVANIGDSKAVLGRQSDEISDRLNAIVLSKDHSLSQYEERLRIQKAGGIVREGRVMGVLEVSRSIGDGQFKTCGVSCVPDIKKCRLTANDRFIVMACDGLWKVFTPQEAINEIKELLKDEATVTETSTNCKYDQACSKLANEAVKRGCEDNVTVMLLCISSNNA
ncbi:Uncharacterised protein g5796 [Pycnogonum litorale]